MEKQIKTHSTFLDRPSLLFNIGELLLVLLPPLILISVMGPWAGEDPIRRTVVVWVTYAIMLVMIWTGMKLRGESWADFGLTFQFVSFRGCLKVFGLSLLVFVLATAGFVLGSILMANITGIPESADFSKYDYLKDNLGMLFLTLGGVYIISSFGEEVIFRAFLINRISELGQKTKKATIIAVILSSIIFGFAHYEWGAMGIVQTGFMGLVMGICYIKLKRRLWILILAHVYMDTILMVQLYLASN